MSEKKIAVALGIFDGVHLGHQAVIKKALYFQKNAYKSGVLTFDLTSVKTKGDKKFLQKNSQRSAIFKKMGVDFEEVLDLEEIKNLSPEDFFQLILVNKLNASVIVCGENFHFGKGGKADVNYLEMLAKKHKIACKIIPFVTFDGMNISSTKICELIKKGEIKLANKMLGYNYFFQDVVQNGKKIGRTLNFPTINQFLSGNCVVPKFGVYASLTYYGEKCYKSITNIGVKPTISDENNVSVETYIIDFNKDIYGEEITVSLTDFIRNERKFASLEELKAQIEQDIKICEN